jgi:hypothetical protein
MSVPVPKGRPKVLDLKPNLAEHRGEKLVKFACEAFRQIDAVYRIIQMFSESLTRTSPRAFLASSLSIPSSPSRSLRSLLTRPLNEGSLRSALICSRVLMSSSSRLMLTLTPLGRRSAVMNWGFLPGRESCKGLILITLMAL